jgi:hypothetical protein
MAGHFQAEFEEWRRECELIDREMDEIALARLSGSNDERQVRKFQFASLVERRNEAARKLLSSRGVVRRVRSLDLGKFALLKDDSEPRRGPGHETDA